VIIPRGPQNFLKKWPKKSKISSKMPFGGRVAFKENFIGGEGIL
jgi:hypothetical protein